MGYSPQFVENFTSIKDRITADPHTPIEVSFQTDSVCSPCPHNIGEGMCNKEAHIQALDQRHADILELHDGQVLSWMEGLGLIREKMTLEAFHRACEGCQWKQLGVCEEAVTKLFL